MTDFDYPRITSYVEEIFKANDIRPELVLDLGCGTGSVTVELAKRGYDVIALDSSIDMLNVLSEKCERSGVKPLILNFDITDFELYGTVDAIVCLTDTLNYVTKMSDLKRVFSLVENYLNPGGIFVFDINTYYKFLNIFGDNVFYQVEDDISYIWKCDFNKRSRICEFDITFFVKEKEGERELYSRIDEIQYEKAYENDQIIKLLEEASFRDIRLYDNMKLDLPGVASERIFVSCRKK
jgi:SAM-dependent methyltransferase